MREHLLTSELFRTLDFATIDAVASRATRRTLLTGETLFERGDVADALFLVVSGRLRVLLDQGETRTVVSELGQGSVVGELALVGDQTRSATVMAVRDTDLIRLSKADFDRLAEEHPVLFKIVSRIVAHRVHAERFGATQAAGATTMTVLPLVDPNIAYGWIHAVLEAIRRLKVRAECIACSRVKAASDPANLNRLLNDLEEKNELIIYQGAPHDRAWTEKCIRRADVLLILTEPGSKGSHQFGAIAAMLDSSLVRREVVLLHRKDEVTPTNTELLLKRWRIDMHHHVRVSDRDDARRLARYFTGNASGVVLGGGGARGFAHIGVLRALEELSIPVDFIGGTSMGAVIAAQHALGWDATELLERNWQAWVRGGRLNDYTLPLASVIRGRKIRIMLQKMFGDARIEDLWTNYFCISVNLTRAEEAVHSTGLLYERVGASISVPGFGPPTIINGELHVDGAVLNSLPGDVMKELCRGQIMVVDVSGDIRMIAPPNIEHYPGGWRLLANRFLPVHRRIEAATMPDIIWRSVTLAAKKKCEQDCRHADLVLVPPVKNFRPFQFNALKEIAEAGYKSTMEAAPNIMKLVQHAV